MLMRVKTIFKRFLPPSVVDAMRWLSREIVNSRPEWEYLPEGWDIRDARITGWNVQSVLDTQRQKWPYFLKSVQGSEPLLIYHEAPISSAINYTVHNTYMAYAYVLALTARKKDRISLLDWGGGIGHYYVISKALLPEVEIDYHCKDVPLLCQGGRELLPEVSFHESEKDCFERSYDLVLVSGSLQFCKDWKGLVQQLVSVSHSYLYITRLPIIHQAASFVVVQRPYWAGYQTEYLGWFLNRQEFLNYMSGLQMELVREFLIEERPLVHRAPEQGHFQGFLFRPLSNLTV